MHVHDVGLAGKNFTFYHFNKNHVERIHGTIRKCNKTQRSLENEDSVFVKGHQLYYNYINPNHGLFGCMPLEVAGIDLGLMDNKWENLLMRSVKISGRIHQMMNKNFYDYLAIKGNNIALPQNGQVKPLFPLFKILEWLKNSIPQHSHLNIFTSRIRLLSPQIYNFKHIFIINSFLFFRRCYLKNEVRITFATP